MSSRTIWDCSAHPELKAVLSKLESHFGASLCLLPSDPEWLTFCVFGMTDFALLQALERERLFGADLLRFQVLAQQRGKERGVSIRYLPDAAAIDGARSGFWLY